MTHHYGAAIDAYKRTAEVGSSDPAVHEGACKVLFQWIYVDSITGRHDTAKTRFHEGKEFAELAIRSDPKRPSAYLCRARIYNTYYSQFTAASDIEAGILITLKLAEEAAIMQPNDAMAQWLVGSQWRRYSSYLWDRGLDEEDATKRAIVFYDKSLELDPLFLASVREKAAMLRRQARSAERRGEDPTPYLNLAAAAHTRALEIAGSALSAASSKWEYEFWIASAQFRSGIDPTKALDNGQRLCDEMLLQQPNSPVVKRSCMMTANLRTELALATGADPTPSLELQNKFVVSIAAQNSFHESYASALITSARVALARGESPETDTLRAIEVLRADGEQGLRQMGYAALTRLRWHVPRRSATARMFDEPLEFLAPVLEERRVDPEPFRVAAAIYERRASWLVDQRKDPADAIMRGLRMVDQSLKRNSRYAPALVARGDLYMVQARVAKTKARAEAARHAKESFDAALVHNKYLASETEANRKEAELMLQEKPASTSR